MALKKGLFIFCLVILVLFTVSSVCASDSDENMTSANMEDNLEISEDFTVIEEGGSEITGEKDPRSFEGLQEKINNGYGSEIRIDDDIYKNDLTCGITINQSITIDGQGHTINAQGKSGIFTITGSNVVIKNITFINGNSPNDGGAIYWSGSDGFVSGCSFVNNTALKGGAIYWLGNDSVVSDCSFVNNTADYGGAILWSGNDSVVSDCSFVNCSAGYGGAICGMYGANGHVSDCSFVENVATSYSAAIDINYSPNCSVSSCYFVNNTAYSIGAVCFFDSENGAVSNCRFVNNTVDYEYGVISWRIGDNGSVSGCYFENNAANGTVGAIYWDGSNGSISGCCFVNNTASDGIIFVYASYGSNITINNNVFLNNHAVDILFSSPDNSSNIDYNWFGNNANNYNNAPNSPNGTFTTWLFLKATANPNAMPVFSTSEILFKLYAYNSTSGKVFEYDNALLKLVNLKITAINGNANMNTAKLGETIKYTATNVGTGRVTAAIGSSAFIIDLKISKATPKITANKKTFKLTVKTKKYTITLKDNKGKAIKNAKVTIKVGKKTYKATTNSKGKATFKITKLNKKGKYNAAITFKGDKYYNKITKKAKITVVFKTLSKGSKDKATVKKIQKALKKKGYYKSNLKINGKYDSNTVKSVKEFQRDKGLKVTGKVDEKTARKLKII